MPGRRPRSRPPRSPRSPGTARRRGGPFGGQDGAGQPEVVEYRCDAGARRDVLACGKNLRVGVRFRRGVGCLGREQQRLLIGDDDREFALDLCSSGEIAKRRVGLAADVDERTGIAGSQLALDGLEID
ncbi:hypothetical protein [Haloarchaeobius sp. HME9146]|uniref:hypothetical protein n=1 Tax=Haloarchaeobius sp. HME9146 TaxID=2978732 RepID=UPI0021BE6759|nr:hypothetical protein [Haloarchaeobius sp. HME9146]MCT9095393.1 hypothetical protein [Haloarchaeobius sp. HME9146]